MRFIHGRLTLYVDGEWTLVWEDGGESHEIYGQITSRYTYPSLVVLNELADDGWDIVLDETPSFKNKHPITTVSCIYLMKKKVGMDE